MSSPTPSLSEKSPPAMSTAIHADDVEKPTMDYDAQRLHDLGYRQEFKRSLDMFVQFAIAFTTMAVLPSWCVGFGPSLQAGGPISMVYGWITVSCFVCVIGACMAEIVSAFPTAGGVYYWCFALSNERWGPFMSWIGGYVSLLGLLATNMTLGWGAAQFIVGAVSLGTGVTLTSQGAYVGIYCAFLVVGGIISSLGMRVVAWVNRFIVFISIAGTIVVVIAMPAMAPSHQTAAFVFSEWINNTGWTNPFNVFLIGMLQAGWTLIGYEVAAQMLEETHNADVAGPRGIVISIGGAIIQGIILIIAVLFSIQDLDTLLISTVPVATLFQAATNNTGVAIFFMVILLLCELGSTINCLVGCGHFMWAMSRDGCLPFSKTLYHVNKWANLPVRAIWAVVFICVVVIIPSFGTIVYWQAILNLAVIAVNVSYGLPFLCRLIWNRHTMPKGPFNLGRFSIPLNVIALIWITFFTIVLCFPSANPVTPQNMNWACLMLGATLIFALVFWAISGRKYYRGPLKMVE